MTFRGYTTSMNKEFDPTLTRRVQNSYAEGMVGPDSGGTEIPPSTSEATTDAASEAEAQARAQKEKLLKDAETIGEKVGDKVAEKLGKTLQDSLQEMQQRMWADARKSVEGDVSRGLMAEDKGRELINTLDNNYYAQAAPEVDLKGKVDEWRRDFLDGSQDTVRRRDSFHGIQNIARELLVKQGITDPTIREIATVDPYTKSDDDLRNLVAKAFRRTPEGAILFNTLIDRAMRSQSEAARGYGYGTKEYNEQQLKQYYPPSLEDVGERIMELEAPEYQTGGKHEIVDENGNIKVWNMRRWMKEKWLKWGHQLSPDDPNESPFKTVSIQSLYTRLDLFTLLTNTMFWRKRWPVMDENGDQVVKNGELQWDYRDDPAYTNLRNELLNAFWLFGKAHTMDATVRPLRGAEKQFFEQVVGLYGQNVWLQGQDRIRVAWSEDATSGDEDQLRKEYAAWMDVPNSGGPQKEGRAGKAHRQADALYFRMAHLEDWDRYDNKGKVDKDNDYIKRMSRHYNYSDNKFYERLGEEGVKEFYTSMVRRGLEGLGDIYGKEDHDFFAITANLQGLDIASIMFTPDKNNLTALFTNAKNVDALRNSQRREILRTLGINVGENEINKTVTSLPFEQRQRYEDLLNSRVNELLHRLPEHAVQLREKILNNLTGWDKNERKLDIKGVVGFRDKNGEAVRDLFKRVAKKDPMALEELGLRFIDVKQGGSQSYQGAKWETDRNTAWRAVRKELNLFNSQSKAPEFDRAVRYAIQDAIGKLNGLDSLDAEYAENFAFSKVYFTFTSGYNDTSATGFDAATKLVRFRDYRENNQDGGKNFVGNTQNRDGINRLLLTLWEGAFGTVSNPDGSKKKASLLSVMEHGFTDTTRSKDRNTLQTINFNRNIESTFGSNHVSKSYALYQRILKGPILDFQKFVKTDMFENVQTAPEAFGAILSEFNNEIRYTFNQLGLNFEDNEEDIQLVWERDANGKMTSRPRFVTKKLKDVLFSRDIVNMGMYERRLFSDNWVNKRVGEKDSNGEDMLTEYSRNVMAYFIAKEILEHRLYNPQESSYNYNIWQLNMVRAIEGLFANIGIGGMDEKNISLFNHNKKLRKRDSFFNRQEFRKIRLMGNAGYLKLWLEELRAQVAESTWKGNTGTGNKFFAYIFQDMWSFK